MEQCVSAGRAGWWSWGCRATTCETILREFRTDIEIFREANVALFAEVEEHIAAYQKIAGGLTADWDGDRKTIPQLQPYLREPDRDVRERAFRRSSQAYLARRDELATLFDTMFGIRQRIAANAGFANFMEYAFPAKHRFDYTPDDCARFHEAVEATVAPAVERLMAHRREALGVDVGAPVGHARPPPRGAPHPPVQRPSRVRGAGQARVRRPRPGARAPSSA